LLWAIADGNRSGQGEFLDRAISIGNAKTIYPVRLRAEDVVLAIADHEAVSRVGVEKGKRVRDQLSFITSDTIQLASEHTMEVPTQPKVNKDLLGEDLRFGCRNVKAISLLFKLSQAAINAWIHLVLVKAKGRKSLPIEADGVL